MTNFIQHTSGALSQQECDAVIDFFETNEQRQEVGTIGSDSIVDPKRKVDTELYVFLNELVENKILEPVASALRNAWEEYCQTYPFLNKGLASWRISHVFKIQKYNPNEAYFEEHCENGGVIDGTMERRLIALMVYLNTVTDGGQTRFPTQNISFSPKVGDILMWPAYWTHPHHGIASPTQKKYIVTGWYVFNDSKEIVPYYANQD
tara:strand:- start:31 stop:648 length:618 start_codon:yes stop_codon:yes gene_type:complete